MHIRQGRIMEELLNIITFFPGECIAIVVGVIGAIIAIASIKKGNAPGKIGISPLYLLIIGMVIICFSILRVANRSRESEPPETTPHVSVVIPQPIPEIDEDKELVDSIETSSKTIFALKKSDFAYVAASSTYDSDRATHGATNLIDGKRETNWTEGVTGNGTGEYVQFEFQNAQTITGFRICSGNHSSDSFYARNARPKEIILTFEDGSCEEFILLDIMEELTFQLSEPVTTKTVRLTIQSVYSGTSWEDTVISEIVFLAAK